jgi:hypothetical protein
MHDINSSHSNGDLHELKLIQVCDHKGPESLQFTSVTMICLNTLFHIITPEHYSLVNYVF